jgi:hypothetical protein
MSALTHTRYVGSTIALLFVGTLVCAFILFMGVMTAGFGADPVHDFRSGAILCDLLAALLSVPAFLAMFRWCGVGSIGVYCIAAFSTLIFLVTGMAGPTGLFTILLFLQSLICWGITSTSEKTELSHLGETR